MQITTTFRTKRNGSPVIKINDEKYLCLDRNTFKVYRTCTDINELDIIEPYTIDFNFTYLLQSYDEDVKKWSNMFMERDKKVSELMEKIYFIEKTLNIPSIYNHCLRLKEKQDKEAAIAEKKRVQDTAKSLGLTVKEYQNFIDIIKSKNFKTSHKMGCVVKVFLDKNLVFSQDTRDYYSGRGNKYNKTIAHGDVSIHFTKKEAKKMQAIGGVITILGKKIDKHITKADVILIEGSAYNTYLNRKVEYITDGYHGETIEACKNWRKLEAQRLILKRKGLADQEIKMELAKYKYVGFDHSLKAGNCESGTRQFARDHNLNTKFGYNLAYLISLDPTNYYIQKML